MSRGLEEQGSVGRDREAPCLWKEMLEGGYGTWTNMLISWQQPLPMQKVQRKLEDHFVIEIGWGDGTAPSTSIEVSVFVVVV